jgi:hypothetical protein
VALLKMVITVWTIMKKKNFITAKLIRNSIAAAITIVLLYYIMSFSSDPRMLTATRSILILGMAYFGFVIREAKTMEYMDTDIIYLILKRTIKSRIRLTMKR